MDSIIPPTHKHCPRCDREKPLSDFYKDKSARDGYYSLCKMCKNLPSPNRIRKNPPPEHKRCSGCLEWKPATLEYFHAHKDGIRSICKVCRKNGVKPFREPPTDHPTKQCTGPCKRILPATSEFFSVQSRGKYGITSQCKRCESERAKARYAQPVVKTRMNAQAKVWETTHRTQRRARKRAYRQEHLEHVREKDRVYAATRNMRQKAVPGTLTQEQIQEKLKKQRYRCYYCAVKFEKRNGRYIYDLEHTIPISRVEAGPRHDVNYVVLACPPCNAKKYDKLPHEWLGSGRLF